MNPDAISEEPLARGLFLCDWLILDAQTKKVSLINLFDRVRAPSFPSPPRPFVVYSSLTNGFGETELKVEIESRDGMQVVYTQSMVRFTDRLAAVNVKFVVTSCSFPKPGGYQVVLYANGSPVSQTRLDVLEQE